MTLPGGKLAANPAVGTAVPPPATSPPGRIWPPDLKEITTTVIALVIVLITTWMIYKAFSNSGDLHPPAGDPPFDKEAFNRSKDILAFALGLFGTVTGYYFGRVPAEKQADAARHSADVARQGQALAENKTEQLRQEVKSNLQDIIKSNSMRPGAALVAEQSHADMVGDLTSLLAAL